MKIAVCLRDRFTNDDDCFVFHQGGFLEVCGLNAVDDKRWIQGMLNIPIVEVEANSVNRTVQSYTGPEDSRRLKLPDLKTIDTCRW